MTTTPPSPPGEPLIYPPPEGNTNPTPQAALASWEKAKAGFTPQGGLVNENSAPK